VRSSFVVWTALALLGAVCWSSHAKADQVQEVVIKVDPVQLIRKASGKYQGKFKLTERAAVVQMDSMLTEQYGSRGRIANERDAYLKSLYYQAAGLLLNGHPIAGGTLVSVARNEPGFAQSPVGSSFASFVDAMLQPTEDDPDLLELQQRRERARKVLAGLRADLRFYADLWLVGNIYRDEIAVDAGKLGVDAMKALVYERKTIQRALAVQ
jgi:hypothetical protein